MFKNKQSLIAVLLSVFLSGLKLTEKSFNRPIYVLA